MIKINSLSQNARNLLSFSPLQYMFDTVSEKPRLAEICAFCTSEYPSADSLAIGIAVDENHRRQGIATKMTNAFLKKAAERDLNVFWECWKNNAPSVQTAMKCGFEKVADYPVLFVEMED